MLSNILSVGKDLANKLSNKFLNLSDIEIKIKEATNDEAWGPSGTLMKEISDETYSTMNFNDIMTYLWYRIFMEKPPEPRRIYKGLVLLQYLIVNGSEYVAVSCREHLGDVRRLDRFSDQNGQPDMNIRKKSQDIVSLLNDPSKLNLERQKAKTAHNRFYGGSGVSNSAAPVTMSSQQLGSFDDWKPGNRSFPIAIGEQFVEFVDTFTRNISGPPPTETHDNYDIPQNAVEFSQTDETLYTDRTNNSNTNKTRNYKVNISSTSNQNTLNDKISAIPNPQINKNPNQIKQTSQNSVPIIDFSEPEPNTTAPISKSNINEMDDLFSINHSENIDEFGNFTSWNSSKNTITTPHNNPNNNTQHLYNNQPDLLIDSGIWNENNKSNQVSLFNEPTSKKHASESWPGVSHNPIDFDLLAQSRSKPSISIINNNNNNTTTLNNSNKENNSTNQSNSVKSLTNKNQFWNGSELSSLNIDLDNLCTTKSPKKTFQTK